MREDTTWAMDLARKLGDSSIEFSVTLDLNADKVTWSKTGSGATGVDAFATGLAMVFNHEGHDCSGKFHVLASVLDAVEHQSARVRKGSGKSWSRQG
jgi:hypothetical protein